MLINNWYVAAASENVKSDESFSARMLGLDFVLFRASDGSVVCLSDTCCHRGGSLSCGVINGEQIACSYHGWEFRPDGACVKIPAFGDDAKIPKRARVDSYPTAERYGWVWTFLGDLPVAERPPLPDLFPEFDDPENWRLVPYQFEAKCNWMRMEENSLDTAHTNFVHRAFGSRHTPKLEVFPIEQTDWGARVNRVKPAPKTASKSGEMAKLIGNERKETRVELEFSVVGVCHRIKPTFRPGMSQINFTARTPIDAYHTQAIGWQARNYLMEPGHDAERKKGLQEAIREDLGIVENIKPVFTPPQLSDEFLTETDGMEIAFRKKVWSLADKGWEIDREKFEEMSKNHALVIPSPARREDPNNWIHKTVPLKPAKEETAQAAE